MIEPKEGSIPPASRLMEDTRFQDWLLRVGIMGRSGDWEEIQPVWKNGGTDEILTNAEWVLLDNLLTNRGYIVAHSKIASLDSKDFSHYSNSYIHRIRSKLENPKLIFSAPKLGFGYGIGIESLRLEAQPGRLLYRLWQDLENWVPRKELALGIYGYADSNEHGGIWALVWRLRHELIGSRATILSYPQIPLGGYTLVENIESHLGGVPA